MPIDFEMKWSTKTNELLKSFSFLFLEVEIMVIKIIIAFKIFNHLIVVAWKFYLSHTFLIT